MVFYDLTKEVQVHLDHDNFFSAWAKKTEAVDESVKMASFDEVEEIPIIPYSSLFILSSENK